MGTPLSANTDPPNPSVESLVRNLDADAVRTKRLLREFLERAPAAFLREAMRVLAAHPETPGARHLLTLLSERDLLLEVLCAPGLSKARALQLARAAASAFPSTDIRIARGLAGMLEAPETTETLNHITRLMDILAEISDAARIFPSIVRLLRHPNPHIRSKAVLMIGRQSRSAQWVRPRLSDSDPRIRANALESLWNVDSGEARELLEALTHDPNNRVAGNALVGLYRLGDARVIPEILNLAAHPSALFRASAAWVMGETGDPRFTDVLAALQREPDAIVRKRAFSALGQLRAATARGSQAPPCRLAARLLEAGPAACRLALTVAGSSGWSSPALHPAHFIVSEDDRIVQSYRAAARPLPETLFVVFLLPVNGSLEVWREAALACFPWKRSNDLWACDFYEGAAAQEAGAGAGAPSFQISLDSVRTEFFRSTLRYECPDLWRALRRLADLESGPSVGKCQFIVFREDVCSAAPPESLVAAIAAAQAAVHVVSTVADPVLEEFCRKTNGSFTLAESNPPDAAIRAYLHQLPQYEISWQPATPGRRVKIRLHSAASGEITLPIPKSAI
jgi:HEAT repeat protein